MEKKDFIYVSLANTLRGIKNGINTVNSAMIIKRANNDKRIANAGIRYFFILQYQIQYILFIISNFE